MSKVLVIEGDETSARAIEQELTHAGMQVRATVDPSQALNEAMRDKPDLILVASELPESSGFSICNAMKKEQTLAGIPVWILSSGHDNDALALHQKLKTHADKYFPRGQSFQDLVAQIRAQAPLTIGPAPINAAPKQAIKEEPKKMRVEKTIQKNDKRPNNATHIAGEPRITPLLATTPVIAAVPAPAPKPAAPAAAPITPATAPVVAKPALATAPAAPKTLESIPTPSEAPAASTRNPDAHNRRVVELCETLHQRDTELIAARADVAAKDREVLSLRGEQLSFERARAELNDQIESLEGNLSGARQQLVQEQEKAQRALEQWKADQATLLERAIQEERERAASEHRTLQAKAGEALQALRDGQGQEIETINAKHRADYAKLEQEMTTRIDGLQREHAQGLEQARTAYDLALRGAETTWEGMRVELVTQIDRLRAELDSMIQTVADTTALTELEARNAREEIARRNTEIELLRSDLRRLRSEIEEVRTTAEKASESSERAHRDELILRETIFAQERDALERSFEAELQSLRTGYDEALRTAQATDEQARQAIAEEVSRLQEEFQRATLRHDESTHQQRAQQSDLRHLIEEKDAAIHALQQEHEIAVGRLQAEYETGKLRLREENLGALQALRLRVETQARAQLAEQQAAFDRQLNGALADASAAHAALLDQLSAAQAKGIEQTSELARREELFSKDREAIEQAFEAELTNIRATYDDAIRSASATDERARQALADEVLRIQERLAEVAAKHEQAVTQERAEKGTLRNIVEEKDRAISELQAAHEAALSTARAEHEAERARLREDHLNALHTLRTKIESDAEEQTIFEREEFDRRLGIALDEATKAHTAMLDRVAAAQAREIEVFRLRMDAARAEAIHALQIAQQNELLELEQQHQTDTESLRAEHLRSLEFARAEYERSLSLTSDSFATLRVELENQIASLTAQLAELNDRIEYEILLRETEGEDLRKQVRESDAARFDSEQARIEERAKLDDQIRHLQFALERHDRTRDEALREQANGFEDRILALEEAHNDALRALNTVQTQTEQKLALAIANATKAQQSLADGIAEGQAKESAHREELALREAAHAEDRLCIEKRFEGELVTLRSGYADALAAAEKTDEIARAAINLEVARLQAEFARSTKDHEAAVGAERARQEELHSVILEKDQAITQLEETHQRALAAMRAEHAAVLARHRDEHLAAMRQLREALQNEASAQVGEERAEFDRRMALALHEASKAHTAMLDRVAVSQTRELQVFRVQMDAAKAEAIHQLQIAQQNELIEVDQRHHSDIELLRAEQVRALELARSEYERAISSTNDAFNAMKAELEANATHLMAQLREVTERLQQESLLRATETQELRKQVQDSDAARYDAEQAQLEERNKQDEQLRQLQFALEKHDRIRADALREQNQAFEQRILILGQAHEDAMRALAEEHSIGLHKAELAGHHRLAALEAQHAEALIQARASYGAAVEEAESAWSAEKTALLGQMNTLRQMQETALAARASETKAIRDERDRLAAECALMQSAVEDTRKAFMARIAERESELRAELERTLQSQSEELTAAYEAQLAAQRDELEARRATDVETVIRRTRDELIRQHQEAIRGLEAKHHQAIRAAETWGSKRADQLISEQETTIEALRRAHDDALKAAESSWNSENRALRSQVQAVSAELRSSRERLEAELLERTNGAEALQEQLSNCKERIATLESETHLAAVERKAALEQLKRELEEKAEDDLVAERIRLEETRTKAIDMLRKETATAIRIAQDEAEATSENHRRDFEARIARERAEWAAERETLAREHENAIHAKIERIHREHAAELIQAREAYEKNQRQAEEAYATGREALEAQIDAITTENRHLVQRLQTEMEMMRQERAGLELEVKERKRSAEKSATRIFDLEARLKEVEEQLSARSTEKSAIEEQVAAARAELATARLREDKLKGKLNQERKAFEKAKVAFESLLPGDASDEG